MGPVIEMTGGAVEEKIHRFIVEELLQELYAGGDPLETGAVDSLGIEQLVDYMETEFGVEFADEEIVAENFASVPVLAALVHAKQVAGAKTP
jgi:acyl carrier protein